MHNPALAALGLDWRYLACDVHPERLREAIAGAQAMKFIGLNLTIPHKLLAVDIVDVLDVSAKRWGAVNTIRFEGRHAQGDWQPLREFVTDSPVEMRSQGFNTDADAIATAVHEDLQLDLCKASVLLLGAGGAGQTAALKLAAEGVTSLFLVNRTTAKVMALAEEVRRQFPSVYVGVGYPKTKVDLVMNATSLGLNPHDPSPLDESQFSLQQAGAVYDMIYRPAETPLLRAAKAAGCKVANGLGMLLYQGTKALEIWTGQPAPVELMRAALLKNVYARA
jgi:shikimate dehydrogenase